MTNTRKESKRVLVIGAGGLAKQMLWDILALDYLPTFYDDTPHNCNVYLESPDYRIANSTEGHFEFMVGVSEPKQREAITQKFSSKNMKVLGLISPAVHIPSSSNIPGDAIILRESIIEPYTDIGCGSLCNVGVYFHHDSKCGRFCEFGPRSTVLGRVEIGDYTFIGAGATIREKVKIGSNVIVGCGSVVVKDIPDNQICYGNPARPSPSR